jgi:carboxyl-terminal processing protease
MAILVDQHSASASEIVAGALQDYDRAVIIGKQTFGKGLVQQTRPLSYNAQLKVTVAKYYIPSGRCIQKVDYSHKDKEGIAHNVPDSLISSFKTLVYDRPVFDGKGIRPDLKTEEQKLSKIAVALLSLHHIFDYATIYKSKHTSIAPPRDFSLTEEEYQDFLSFLKGKQYHYLTKSEEILDELKKAAAKEKYFSRIEAEYEVLAAEIEKEKDDDLVHFKEEIKQLLENEIVSRYYFQDGRIEQSLNDDLDVLQAMQLLSNQDRYKDILAGRFSEENKGN